MSLTCQPWFRCLAVVLGLAAGAAAGLAAEEPAKDPPGQEDLNAAIDAKLAVDELDDFGRVLALCRRAIDRGLDEESLKFAEDLYTGTLMDRAGMLVEAIYDQRRRTPQWERIRLFAMRDLDEVIERDPKLGSAQLMIARLQSLPGGDRERAAAAAAKALGLLGDNKLQRAQATLVLATLAEDPREKGAFFDVAVDLAPRDAEIRQSRGLFRLTIDDFEGARKDLAVAVKEEPRSAKLQEALGMACMMDDRLDEAKEAFDRAIELEPDAPTLLLQRARILANAGDMPAALEDIDRALEIAPREQTALLLRARINQQAGETAAALADLETVLERDPNAPAALEMRGLIAMDRGDHQSAIRDFRRLAARDPNNTALIAQLGMLYLAAEQPREAIRRFSRALEIDADNFPCRRGRSDAEISIGDHAAALEDLELAHELEPDDTGVLNNLAWLLATSPDDEIRDGRRAIELAEKACELTGWEEAHIISTLAAAHAETGDFAAAQTYSRQAVDTGSNLGEVAEQLRAELESYRAEKPWRERQAMGEAGEPPGPAGEERADDEPAGRADEEPMLEKRGDEPPPRAAEKREPRRPFIDD